MADLAAHAQFWRADLERAFLEPPGCPAGAMPPIDLEGVIISVNEVERFRGRANKMKYLGLAACTAIALAAANPADAAVVMSSVDLSTATVSTPFVLSGFDASLGSLTSVSLELTGTGTASGPVFLFPASGFSYPVTATFARPTASVSLGGGSAVVSGTFKFSPDNVQIDTFGQNVSLMGSLDAKNVYSDNLSSFIGPVVTGTATNPFFITYSAGFGSIGSGVLLTTAKSLTLTATYTYDVAPTGPIPEVATWAMMILGMAAIGYSMRRSNVKFDAKIKRMTAAVA